MKRILTGIDAYSAMLTTPLPEKTKTYTPVSHKEIMNLVRKQLGFRGFRLTDEIYSCNQTGTVATVAFVFEYVADPEMSMSAVFVNSYDKTAKFQFKLGGLSKKHGTLVISDGFSGSHIRRKHTGSAVDIINEHIEESFNAIHMVWVALQDFKDKLVNYDILTRSDASAYVLGTLVVDDVVDSTQLSQIRDLLRSANSTLSLWDYYHICAAGMRSMHPKYWHDSHTYLAHTIGKVPDKFGKITVTGPVFPTTRVEELMEMVLKSPLTTVLSPSEIPF